MTYLSQLINEKDTEPGASVTFDPTTLKPIDHDKKGVGQPRLHWYKVTIEDLWTETKKTIETVKYASALNFDNDTHTHTHTHTHLTAILLYAESRKKT